MSQHFHYFHPLTPESDRYDIDLGTAAVRLGDVPGWATAAEMGDVAQTNIVIDDPDGTAGLYGDAITGLWTFYVEEDDCADVGSGGDGTGGTRLFTGYITDRTYRRGNTAPSTSLVQGAARRIDISLTDVNALATFRIIAGLGSGEDDGNRPAETDVERVEWLISTVWLPVTDDAGWVDHGNPVDMDACDYRGQTPADVLSDCSLASGKNWWIQYFEPTNTDVLWYQDSNTSTEYTSDIILSDDLGEVDFETVFPYMPDAELRRSPERVYAGIYLPYANGAVYEENGTTAGVFAWRDGSAPTSNVNTETKAIAVAQRLLADADAEDDRITCRVQLPSSLATAIKAGQRLQFRSTFMPGYDRYRWMRVQRCSVAQDEMTQERYTFTLELSPQNPPLGEYDVFDWYEGSSGVRLWGRGYTEVKDYAPTPLPYDFAKHGLIVGVVLSTCLNSSQGPFDLAPDVVEIDRLFDFTGGYGQCLWLGDCDVTGTTSQFWGWAENGNVACDIMEFEPSTGSARTREQYKLGTGTSVTLDSAPTAGNLLVLGVGADEWSNRPAHRFPEQAGWTPFSPGLVFADYDSFAMRAYWKTSVGAADQTVTIDPGSNLNTILGVVEYSA